MKVFLKPKMNFIVMFFILLTFMILDAFVIPKIVSHKISAESDYRTPLKFGYAELKILIDTVNSDQKPKIIIIGDSVIQGGGVNSGSETIAHYLQGNLTDSGSPYRVYNLGLSGASPADVFFILRAIDIRKQDIIIYNFNVGHYNSSNRITYPLFTGVLSAKAYNGKPLHSKLKLQEDKIEDHLKRWVLNSWKLYAYRDVLNEIWDEKVKGIVEETSRYTTEPWYMKDWTEQTKGKGKRGASAFNEHEPQMYFTKILIDITIDSKASMLVFNTPLNQVMMEQYEMIDRQSYDNYINKLAVVIQEHNALFQDYESLIPSEFFTDSIHPTKDGNRILANELMNDLMTLKRGPL